MCQVGHLLKKDLTMCCYLDDHNYYYDNESNHQCSQARSLALGQTLSVALMVVRRQTTRVWNWLKIICDGFKREKLIIELFRVI